MPAILAELATLLALAFVVIPPSHFVTAQRSAVDTYAITTRECHRRWTSNCRAQW